MTAVEREGVMHIRQHQAALRGAASWSMIKAATAHPDATRVKRARDDRIVRWAGYAGATVGRCIGAGVAIFAGAIAGGLLVKWLAQ